MRWSASEEWRLDYCQHWSLWYKFPSNTYAVTSSVASLPIMCMIALSPPGWYCNQASTFSTFPSTTMIVLPLAIRSSTSSLLYTRSFRLEMAALAIAGDLRSDCSWQCEYEDLRAQFAAQTQSKVEVYRRLKQIKTPCFIPHAKSFAIETTISNIGLSPRSTFGDGVDRKPSTVMARP